MDQTTEEALRQELTYLRNKLQDQGSGDHTECEQELVKLSDENARLTTLIEGKTMNFQLGDVLLVENMDLIARDPDTWLKLAKKFQISIISLPNKGLAALSKATDEQLSEAGLQKIKPLQPYAHLDQLMHHLQAKLDTAKSVAKTDYITLIKNGMSETYQAMETMKSISEYIQDENNVQAKAIE
jgi:hypothetical protein